MDQDRKKRLAETMEMKDYLIVGEFGRVICLPDDQKYSLCFSVAEHEEIMRNDKKKGELT